MILIAIVLKNCSGIVGRFFTISSLIHTVQLAFPSHVVVDNVPKNSALLVGDSLSFVHNNALRFLPKND